MAAEPLPPTVDDTIDEELLVSAREMFTKHLQSDRRPVKWITSVERAWSKSGRALKAGKAHTSANARVTGYVPGYAGQAVWVSPSAHRKPVHSDLWMMPSESPPPKTSHRKLQQSRTQSFAAPRIAVRPMTPNPKVKPAIPRPSPPESPRRPIGRPPSRARAVMMSSEAPVAMDPLSSRSPLPQSQRLVVTSRPTTAAALLGLQ